MTTKKKFVSPDPEVVVLRNGRYAYRAECPWEGKQGKRLVAFKFCSAQTYHDYVERQNASTEEQNPSAEDQDSDADSEH
jgi:hypothetical protein